MECAHWGSDHMSIKDMAMQEVFCKYFSCWINVYFTVLTLDIYLYMLIMRILYVHENALHSTCIALDIRHFL